MSSVKIALLGYGVEGESAYKYYKNIYPAAEFVAYDDKPAPKNTLPGGMKFSGNQHDFHNIRADIVVRTPAIAPSRVSSSGTVTSATIEFFAQCPAPIIGVTGTKGKGTTCSLIYEILKAAGKKAWLVGNIGTPALDVLGSIKAEDIVVYELSSFQLWDLQASPQVAVVLMLEADHLDVHSSFDEYLKAKANISAHQSQDDVTVYHPTNQYSRHIAELSPAKIKKKFFTPEGAYVDHETVVIDEQEICSINEIGLIGKHNLENVCAAVTVAWQFTKDTAAIRKAITHFKGLEHRLKFVREVNSVQYFDDSISTTPGSAIAALTSFEQPKVIILGGISKGADFNELAQNIAGASIRKVILIGTEAEHIQAELDKVQFENYEHFKEKNMTKLVQHTAEIAQSGDIVILSPACGSFDDFKNYADRGNQFVKAVKSLNF